MLYVAIIFTLICSFILPLLAFFMFPRFFKGTRKAVIFGIMTFVVSQVVIRLPLLQILGLVWPTYVNWLNSPNFMYCLFLGATAAIFEEGARYLVINFLLKKHQTDVDGLAFGLGHGGIEAILFVGLNYAVLLPMAITGTAVALETIAAGDIFLAGAERAFTMIFHVAWSLMIMKSIQKKNSLGFFIALATHALLDTAVAYFMLKGMNVYFLELLLGIFTILPLVYIIWTIKKDMKKEPQIFQRIEEKHGNN